MMHREAFVMKLKDGMAEEYKRRHREVWPEMLGFLREAGIRNYSIWQSGGMLFGYYECDDIQAVEAAKANSDVQKRWNEYMRDVITPVALRSAGNPPERAFLME